MLDAHVKAGQIVGTPFGTEGVYDFGAHQQVTKRVSELGSTMLQHRKTAPPVEAYSLHRRLSGAFLANIRLRSRVRCKDLFDDVYAQYQLEEAGNGSSAAKSAQAGRMQDSKATAMQQEQQAVIA